MISSLLLIHYGIEHHQIELTWVLIINLVLEHQKSLLAAAQVPDLQLVWQLMLHFRIQFVIDLVMLNKWSN